MDRFGVALSLVSNLNGIFYKNTQSANEELNAEIESDNRFSKRIIPFAVINPIYGGWKHDFKVCTKEMKMKGIRMYPKYHGYSLADPACIELVESARDQGLPVAISLRVVDSRPSSWMDLENKTEWALRDVLSIIRKVPDAKYLLLNIANSMVLNDEDRDLVKKTDLIMDTSGRALTDLGEQIQTLGKDKFAFGTHSPILDELTGLLRIESLGENEADEATKELLRSGNVKRILAI
jgi:predicted TIM-barrel fold metal-dependent hydrolase